MSCEQSLRTCGGLPTYHLTAGSLRAIPTSMGKLLPRSLSIMLCPSNPPLFSGGLESAVTVVGAVGCGHCCDGRRQLCVVSFPWV